MPFVFVALFLLLQWDFCTQCSWEPLTFGNMRLFLVFILLDMATVFHTLITWSSLTIFLTCLQHMCFLFVHQWLQPNPYCKCSHISWPKLEAHSCILFLADFLFNVFKILTIQWPPPSYYFHLRSDHQLCPSQVFSGDIWWDSPVQHPTPLQKSATTGVITLMGNLSFYWFRRKCFVLPLSLHFFIMDQVQLVISKSILQV